MILDEYVHSPEFLIIVWIADVYFTCAEGGHVMLRLHCEGRVVSTGTQLERDDFPM